ncbi:hypothetical protein P154DRAFT_521780 [Amniculicola lignicola CBS 123094]|uniref:PRP1 splicing factor N-terminal domain-containing protein n=1 Tax=Amniculicola lignicola CBS 123094 TaxID=1392246 RepID=A0A6A5WIY0_9PLEO|nr:hypothetical protein P154DRAFT_521780 [Amniculicola lignicola CBS 123094]
MSARQNFLTMAAPENYVAGLGRGATGFTTRSDLGPAREGPSEDQMKAMLAKRAEQLGQPAPTAYGATEKKEEDEEDDRFQDPDNEVGLFSSGLAHDAEDDEADRIYQEVDEKLDRRRRARRELREKKEQEEHERNNPKITLVFADLKRDLEKMSEEEWAQLPEVGDMTGKAKRAREARMSSLRSYAVPDSVMAAAARSGEFETSISADGGDGTMTNFGAIGAAQVSALQVRLDTAASKTEGTRTAVAGTSTTVDPQGYITELNQTDFGHGVEDVNRARLLLESAVRTNKNNGPSYVALARLEELAGKKHTAKKVLQQGCENCPKSIVVWEEAIRMHREDSVRNAKVISAQGIEENPKSVRLWLAAIDLEVGSDKKKKVIRQALDYNPQSVELWKLLINETADIENVRLLFAKAVETVRISEELWISYARISDPEQAQQILNAARKALPTSSQIWIQACRLQEQLGRGNMCDKIMERAVKALTKDTAMPKRETWIENAHKCESEGAVHTAAAIIKSTIGWSLDEDDDRRERWLNDAEASALSGYIATARAIAAYAIRIFTIDAKVWLKAADLEKRYGTPDTILDILKRSIAACPNSEELWLLYIRAMWDSGQKEEARNMIAKSMDQLSDNENIYLHLVEMEIEDGNISEARLWLEGAREDAATDRVYIKSATLERDHGTLDEALDMVNKGLQFFPAGWKLHAIKGQIYEQMDKKKEAQEAFSVGTRACPNAPILYILLSHLQEAQGATIKARSTLDRGRQKNTKSEILFCESVRLELRANNKAAAQQLMSVALQECPTSGLLWSEKIMRLEQRTQRRPRALEAIKRVEADPQLFAVVARIFWSERKLDKADTWFLKAIKANPDFGDAWVWYYKFLLEYGTEEKKADLLGKIAFAEPRHGEIWQAVNKNPTTSRLSIEDKLRLAVGNLVD